MHSRVTTVDNPELRVGEARVLRVSGLRSGRSALVFVDSVERVSRVRIGAQELFHIPWEVQQAMFEAATEPDE